MSRKIYFREFKTSGTFMYFFIIPKILLDANLYRRTAQGNRILSKEHDSDHYWDVWFALVAASLAGGMMSLTACGIICT
jgi:hypothetical protein